MKQLLADTIFSDRLRYEGHRLVYMLEEEEPIELGGFLGAAILAALIVDTDEGEARGIALDTDEEQQAFFLRYDKETRRDDWGYLSAEIVQLRDNYIQIAVGDHSLKELCPNLRLLDLAMNLTVTYMQRLVKDIYRDHIWEVMPWKTNFPQWLIDAARVETRRQRYFHTDWTDAAIVNELAEMPDETERPTFYFEGEKGADIMERYLEWFSEVFVAMKEELPGAKITSDDRKYIFEQETDWAFLSDEIAQLSPAEQKEWKHWCKEWTTFLKDRLLPKKEIRFWVNDVPKEVQEHLLYHLQLAERHPNHFKDLTAAVYAMRQLGYIRRKCGDKDMRQWLSEHLSIDYTEHKNASQFRRAMNEHGRYTPEVQDEVFALESMGYFRFQPPVDPDKSGCTSN